MANVMKRGKAWQARITWRDENGKLHQKSKLGFPTKAAARKYATKLENNHDEGMNVVTNPTFTDYYQTWYQTYKANSVSDNTKRHYVIVGHLIDKFFKKRKLKEVARQNYQSFINWYGKDHAPETVKKVRTISSACVRSAMADGLIFKDFTINVSLVANKSHKMKVEYLSLNEINQLIAEATRDLKPAYTSKYMILTAMYTGARLGEIQALTWKDIDEVHRTIAITKSWDYLHKGGFKPTKNKSSVRTIRVNTQLLRYLNQLRENGNLLVFANDYGNVPTSNAVNKELRLLMRKAGIHKRGFHFHSLRHSHVAYLLSQGADLYAISKRLGHSNMLTTGKVYAYLIDEFKAKTNDQIEKSLDNLGR